MFSRHPLGAFLTGMAVGVLGGLIGLGGAEFRLPVLISVFGFAAIEAVIINKAASLIVVASALLFRLKTIPFAEISNHWSIIVTLLSGSLLGAWLAASWATKLRSEAFYKIIAIVMAMIAIVLLAGHGVIGNGPLLEQPALTIVGILAGFVIGVVASLLGVAGGELLIPTITILFGSEIKLAGSLSLAVSLPTMLAGFTRYSQDRSFSVLEKNRAFLFAMAAGSIAGAFVGGQLLGIVPDSVLLPGLAGLLLLSALKIWRQAS